MIVANHHSPSAITYINQHLSSWSSIIIPECLAPNVVFESIAIYWSIHRWKHTIIGAVLFMNTKGLKIAV